MSQAEDLEAIREALMDANQELMDIQALAWAAHHALLDNNDATITTQELQDRVASMCRVIDQRSDSLRERLDRAEGRCIRRCEDGQLTTASAD